MTAKSNADRQREFRDRQRGGPSRVAATCGSTGAYRRGCRCEACRAAWAAYMRARRSR